MTVKRLLIACGMNRPEIERIMRRLGCDYNTVFMDASLHDLPERLKAELQKVIDGAAGYDELLLGFGNCGKALDGIRAAHCDLLYIDRADCIEAFLANAENLAQLRTTSYFLSEGWLTAENGLLDQLEHLKKKYGAKSSARVIDMMFAHYKNVVYIQTEERIADSILMRLEKFAELTGLEIQFEAGNVSLYERLLAGAQGGGVKRLPKGGAIEF